MQRGVRIHGDGVLYFFQKRQIVQRIAIKAGAGQAIETRAVMFQKLFQARDFAFAKTRRALH